MAPEVSGTPSHRAASRATTAAAAVTELLTARPQKSLSAATTAGLGEDVGEDAGFVYAWPAKTGKTSMRLRKIYIHLVLFNKKGVFPSLIGPSRTESTSFPTSSPSPAVIVSVNGSSKSISSR